MEIQFRGYTKDTNTWIEGNLKQDQDEEKTYISRWIHQYGESGLRVELKETEVFPESVGQFTGKKDRKGKPIFSGDILEDTEGVRMTVEWSDRCAGWSLRSKDWAYEHFFGEAVEEEDVKIIGNVFEDDALVDGIQKESNWHLYPSEKPPTTGQYHCITKDGKQFVCDYGYSHLYEKNAFFYARGVVTVIAWKELEDIPEEIQKKVEDK